VVVEPVEYLRLARYRASVPRIRLVYDIAGAADRDKALTALPSAAFDPVNAVLVEGVATARSALPASIVKVLVDEPERIVLHVDAEAPGVILVSDRFAAGWRSTVDGRPEEILRANALFRANRVSPGEHEVELHYSPDWQLGVGLSGATLLTILGAVDALQGGRPRDERKGAPGKVTRVSPPIAKLSRPRRSQISTRVWESRRDVSRSVRNVPSGSPVSVSIRPR
jgi:hypothetical protein